MVSIISCGDIHLNLLFALIGGVGKCIAGSILYNFKLEMNNHPFILGINAGLGMCLSGIPLIWMKIKNRGLNEKNKIKDKRLYDKDYINRYKESKIILYKIYIILLSSILDFLQKILVFLFSYSIENNIWVFNILFLNIFSICLLNTKLYKHQYFSSIVIIILGIILNIINLYNKIEINNIPALLLSIFIEIIYSLTIVVNKYGMEYCFCTPYELSFYEGLFALILNIAFLIYSSNIIISEDSYLIDICKYTVYNKNIYLDNFSQYYKKLNSNEIIAFIINMLSRGIFNLFSLITIKDYTPSHVIFLLILGEMQTAFELKDLWILVITIIFYIIIFFMTLIFTEIIELNFLGLEENTKKNIQLRVSQNENNEENFIDHEIEIGGVKICLSINDNDAEKINEEVGKIKS